MITHNQALEDIIDTNALTIQGAVIARLPNETFDFEVIADEQERRRRRLRGMTTRLHKDWSSLDHERRSAACRFEWARLQIFLATVVFPVLQNGNCGLYLVELADPRWRVPLDDLTATAFLFPNREFNRGIYALRGMGYKPKYVVSYAMSGSFSEIGLYYFQPQANILLYDVSESSIRSAFREFSPRLPHENSSVSDIIRVPTADSGLALASMTMLTAEDSFVEERGRYWASMPSKEELQWMHLMAAIPITDMVDFGGFDEPLNWWFGNERMATLLDALTLAP